MPQARRFLIRFVIAIVVLYALVALPAVNDRVVVPYTAAVTRATVAACRAVGLEPSAQGTIIGGPGFAMDVENGCNGVEAVVLLVAAVVAFPATLRQRAIGLVAGFAVVQVVNVLRLMMLYWLGVYHRSWFDLFHVTVWQTIVIFITLVYFLFWSSRIANRTAA